MCELLREEGESFMRNDDVNLIDGLELIMNMSDETRVQKQYNGVQKGVTKNCGEPQ